MPSPPSFIRNVQASARVNLETRPLPLGSKCESLKGTGMSSVGPTVCKLDSLVVRQVVPNLI